MHGDKNGVYEGRRVWKNGEVNNGETIKTIKDGRREKGEGEVDELMNADATLILTLTPSPIFGYITQNIRITNQPPSHNFIIVLFHYKQFKLASYVHMPSQIYEMGFTGYFLVFGCLRII